MSEQTEKSQNTFTLYAVKLYRTKNDENKFVAIKNQLSKKELENDYYDVTTPNEDQYETFTGSKFFDKEELESAGIDFQKQGQKYNMKFEIGEVGEDLEEPKAKLLSADEVESWTDSISVSMSDVRYSKTSNKPFVVLYHSITEDKFENAGNKDEFVETMENLGLHSELVAYKGWINFNAFVWLFDSEVEKMKNYKQRKRQWTLNFERINKGTTTIKRIYGETFPQDLLLEATVKEISEDKKTVVLEKLTSWKELQDNKSLNLMHFAFEKEYLQDIPENEPNMILKYRVLLVEPTEVEAEDVVEIYLNDSNVQKLKNPKITLNSLELNNPFEEEEENIEEKESEKEIEEDEIPFG